MEQLQDYDDRMPTSIRDAQKTSEREDIAKGQLLSSPVFPCVLLCCGVKSIVVRKLCFSSITLLSVTMLATAVLRSLTLLCTISCAVTAASTQQATVQRTQTLGGRQFPTFIEVTTEDLQHGLEQNLFTSQDLVKTYLARIMEVNGTLHAVTEVNPDAMAIAKGLDKERKAGKVRGPLHGMPILIKGSQSALLAITLFSVIATTLSGRR